MFRIRIIILLNAFLLFGSFYIDCHAQVQSDLKQITDAFENQDWKTTESLCLQALWHQRSGVEAFENALTLARTCIQLHKAPQAMEWLEIIKDQNIGNPEIESLRSNMLRNMQRIYLTQSGYKLNSQFRIVGTELDGPVDLSMTDTGELVVMDRYRQITLREEHPNLFQPAPPTIPLPDDCRSVKVAENEPVVITRYGYWIENRLHYFGSPEQLSRIIDATYTSDAEWLVLDRRNAEMLHVDRQGKITNQTKIPTLNGNEKIVANVFGGGWILHPVSRQILTAGASIDVKISFTGPGYHLEDPIDIATDRLGHLFVLCEDSTVTIFSPAGIRLKVLKLDPSEKLLKDPQAIIVSDDGRLFIADRKKHEIYCYH